MSMKKAHDRKLRHVVWSALMVAAVLASLPAGAHVGASGIVKERMDDMEAIARAMKRIVEHANDDRIFDRGDVALQASLIAGKAGRMEALYPPASNPPPSEAADEIWRDWEGFLAEANLMKVRAQSLMSSPMTAETRRDIANDVTALAKSCRSCHERYRIAR